MVPLVAASVAWAPRGNKTATFELNHLDLFDSLLITIPYKNWDFGQSPRQFNTLFALRRQGPQFESAWGHRLVNPGVFGQSGPARPPGFAEFARFALPRPGGWYAARIPASCVMSTPNSVAQGVEQPVEADPVVRHDIRIRLAGEKTGRGSDHHRAVAGEEEGRQ